MPRLCMSLMATNSPLLHRFGQRVRELREAKGMSQEEFAAVCGLDRTYISGIERGKRNVSLQNIQIISKALGARLVELFDGIE